MLYLVGGVYRTGKTVLAQRVLADKSVPFVSTDSLLHMLKNAAPELGVTDKSPLIHRADAFYPFLEQFVKYALYSTPDYLIEGDVVWPRHAAKLQKTHEIRAVFLGFSAVSPENITKHAGHNDWVSSMSPDELKDLAEGMVKISGQISDECQEFGMQYVDLAGDYGAGLDRALEQLTGQTNG
jgi:hypothetical protein